MDWITSPESWIALLTLTSLEIVLGIDNIIFISILAGKLPEHQQNLGRQIGLVMAMVTRILLLFSIAWLTRLTTPLFSLFSHDVSGRDLILIAGGLFLLGKSTFEIHERLEGEEGHGDKKVAVSLGGVIFQIMTDYGVVTVESGDPDAQFALARFNPDGTLDDGSQADTDPSDRFGTDGR